ncbi:hypothetical protein [Sporichthya polymorpha]|uniref:hypothetical protein n=1 Tax=Sporichthya polymorpha TaxID=35751 RepID=UPI00037D83D6|nr:hypothetical protein [Sporichthya polymorpha]
MRAAIGQTLASIVDATTVVVVRWPDADVDLTCGGAPMIDPKGPDAGATAELDPAQSAGAQLGKRYVADGLDLELLCTKAGTGTLAVNGAALAIKTAKPLPASD